MNKNLFGTRRILALFLPFLETERISKIYANAPDLPPGEPFVLTAKIKGAVTIMAADRNAAHMGIMRGMKLADARAQIPELRAFDHDPREDAVLLGNLAEACLRYTPLSAAMPPDALILDISGCTHFFGKIDTAAQRAQAENRLAEDVEDRLDRAGFEALWAIAGTGDAALALARYGLREGAEAQLPVAALGMDDKTHRALERAGLYHIGDLAARPRANLAARFGSELGLKLDRILGREDRPVNPLRRLGNVMAERRFAEPSTHVDFALSCLAELFAEAAGEMERRGQGARMIRMLLFRCDGDVARLTIETGAATRDQALFKRLLRERIHALDDPLNPGFGYDLIRLTITAAENMTVQQYQLEGGEDQKGDEAALIGQLSTRLGRGRIVRFAPADSHIPEQALLALPALDSPPPYKWPLATGEQPPLRPLHMFDPPQRIEVMAEVPDGPPRRFKWRRRLHHISRYEGPERIASQWWQHKDGQKAGKGGLTRDYYRVEDVRGRRYWLFRHGLYDRERPDPNWYIHGLFA
ncbi:Y-family DNA polymerase [Sphingorhabdus arenilitoris]|uniref:Y-family DNA polymerase n=1 Tax=Sphingorhabdus arenilitoris TaxID=1490041 RepID=A0ABV8RIN1_9SPHN